MVVRLPPIHWAVAGLEKELEWLPRLAPHPPVEIPTPLATGSPDDEYRWPCAVYRWLDGENPGIGRVEDPGSLAAELAEFLRALRRVELAGPPTRRGEPLRTQGEAVRPALAELGGDIDVVAATSASIALIALPYYKDTNPGFADVARDLIREVLADA